MSKVNWKNQKYLQQIVAESTTTTDVLAQLGLRNVGGNYKTLQRYLSLYEISTDHFEANYDRMVKLNKKAAIPLQEILEGKHPQYGTFKLKSRLLKAGTLKNICDGCGQGGCWNNKHLKMQLDHIDGNSANHKLENLRMLCPNCHSQTDTYAGKNSSIAGTTKYPKKYGTRDAYCTHIREEYKQSQLPLVEKVSTSKIDFSKHGWVSKVSKLINQKPQKVGEWMQKMLPDFYETECYKRKSRLIE